MLGSIRRRLRATSARLSRRIRYGDRASEFPAVFGNSMAKAGSHLLAQFLEGLTAITPLLFVEPYPIRTITLDGRRRSVEWVTGELRRLRAGEIRWGYLPARPEYVDGLLRAAQVVYFLYRDPRDKVVSHILYALEIHKGHAMRGYYQDLPGMEERIEATIRGVPGLVGDIRASYDSYLAWLDQPDVMAVAFEDLMRNREACLVRMLSHLERTGIEFRSGQAQALGLLRETMSPRRSPTYRAASPGNWQHYFTDANKRSFKEVAGDLLVRLGYEQDSDW
jgi:hypothetical protein